MFKGTRKYWFIAVVCGIAAVLLSYQYLQDIKSRYRPDDLVQVVKARQAISKDSLITKKQVELDSLPAKFVHPDSINDLKLVVGKTAITDIAAGEEILKQRLVSVNEKSDRLAYSIPVSKRAVSIPIDSISGVSGYIKAGDRVDIIVTADIAMGDTAGNTNAFSVLSLQDIEVLAVGENPELLNKKSAEGAKSITLAVSIKEAQPLILGSERGNLRLLLRPPVDKSKTSLVPFQLKDLLLNTVPQY